MKSPFIQILSHEITIFWPVQSLCLVTSPGNPHVFKSFPVLSLPTPSAAFPQGLAFDIFHSREDPFCMGEILDLRRSGEAERLGLGWRYISPRKMLSGLGISLRNLQKCRFCHGIKGFDLCSEKPIAECCSKFC